MPKISAGLLMFRRGPETIEIFLVHPGGPFWEKKDLGAWSIPKGEVAPDEDFLSAAMREFEEETSIRPSGPFIPLPPVKQPGGKIVCAWAFEGDCDPQAIRSNTFVIEWPPRSGSNREFPEVDRAAWFGIEEAKKRINKAQARLLDALLSIKVPGP